MQRPEPVLPPVLEDPPALLEPPVLFPPELVPAEAPLFVPELVVEPPQPTRRRENVVTKAKRMAPTLARGVPE